MQKTETRNRKFAKREEILGGSRARIWSGPDFQKNGKLKNGKLKKKYAKVCKRKREKNMKTRFFQPLAKIAPRVELDSSLDAEVIEGIRS